MISKSIPPKLHVALTVRLSLVVARAEPEGAYTCVAVPVIDQDQYAWGKLLPKIWLSARTCGRGARSASTSATDPRRRSGRIDFRPGLFAQESYDKARDETGGEDSELLRCEGGTTLKRNLTGNRVLVDVFFLCVVEAHKGLDRTR